METISYKTKGTCCRQIQVECKDGCVSSVQFEGGCHGNLQGIARLVEGMPVEEVIKRVKGLDCKGRGTSCPDQLALALEQLAK